MEDELEKEREAGRQRKSSTLSDAGQVLVQKSESLRVSTISITGDISPV